MSRLLTTTLIGAASANNEVHNAMVSLLRRAFGAGDSAQMRAI